MTHTTLGVKLPGMATTLARLLKWEAEIDKSVRERSDELRRTITDLGRRLDKRALCHRADIAETTLYEFLASRRKLSVATLNRVSLALLKIMQELS